MSTRLRPLALSAVRASTGRLRQTASGARPIGDPMEVALHVLALRCEVDVAAEESEAPVRERLPFDARRRRVAVLAGDALHVNGSPETVLPLCRPSEAAQEAVSTLSGRGLRVLAVARGTGLSAVEVPVADLEERPGQPLELLGLVGLEDPPRPDVAKAVAECRTAGIRVAMITGDHPATAQAVADHVGLHLPGAPVLLGAELPEDLEALGVLVDVDGVVVARVDPEQKLKIARALKKRGHVVAMTGDGVNDGPALQEADVGVAMGQGGTDTAREAADLVLLDDHFATIVAAVRQGRATFVNVRRFLTYHLTDNVAELAPFVLWAVSGGSFPLAIGVLQVLALDLGTDLLPALALGAEPAHGKASAGTVMRRRLIDGMLLRRAFGVLGLTESVVALSGFAMVLVAGGWRWGDSPPASLLATASGTAFTAIVLGQLANAFACRSETRTVTATGLRGNHLLLVAVVVELSALAVFLFVPPVARLLGGSPPNALGWLVAASAVPAVWLVDTVQKTIRSRNDRRNG